MTAIIGTEMVELSEEALSQVFGECGLVFGPSVCPPVFGPSGAIPPVLPPRPVFGLSGAIPPVFGGV